MIGLLQRVSEAQVVIDGEVVGRIGRGLAVLIGVERDDDRRSADRLLERLLDYRVFPDGQGRMNLSCRDVGGGLLLVPQFTLVADTAKGTRPSFSGGAGAELGTTLFAYLVDQAGRIHREVAAGRFGADMQLALINDGPVTFSLRAVPGR